MEDSAETWSPFVFIYFLLLFYLKIAIHIYNKFNQLNLSPWIDNIHTKYKHKKLIFM